MVAPRNQTSAWLHVLAVACVCVCAASDARFRSLNRSLKLFCSECSAFSQPSWSLRFLVACDVRRSYSSPTSVRTALGGVNQKAQADRITSAEHAATNTHLSRRKWPDYRAHAPLSIAAIASSLCAGFAAILMWRFSSIEFLTGILGAITAAKQAVPEYYLPYLVTKCRSSLSLTSAWEILGA